MSETRREKVSLRIAAKVGKNNKRYLKGVCNKLYQTGSKTLAVGDTMEISWGFDISYLSGIDKRLAVIIDLCGRDDMTITNVDVKEIMHGKILVKEFFNKLEDLQKKIEDTQREYSEF